MCKKMVGTAVIGLVALFMTAAAVQAKVAPLVSTQWVADNLATIQDTSQTKIRLLEVSVKGYDKGHIPGAIFFNWKKDAFSPNTDHMVHSLGEIERMLRKYGLTNDTHIVIYDGDNNHPQHLARIYWTLKYWNFADVSMMDGNKALWQVQGRSLSTDVPAIAPRNIEVAYPPNTKIRAMYSPHVTTALATENAILVDSRQPDFFDGKKYFIDKWVRSGHITGAINAPTEFTLNKDKTFMDVAALKKFYADRGITPDKKIIAYCDTGALAAHGWFVLQELLGYPHVTMYDGSMREYANRFDTPMVPGVVGGKFPQTPIQRLEEKVGLK